VVIDTDGPAGGQQGMMEEDSGTTTDCEQVTRRMASHRSTCTRPASSEESKGRESMRGEVIEVQVEMKQ